MPATDRNLYVSSQPLGWGSLNPPVILVSVATVALCPVLLPIAAGSARRIDSILLA